MQARCSRVLDHIKLLESMKLPADRSGKVIIAIRECEGHVSKLAIELKEEKAWLVRFIVIAIAALYLLTFGLLLAVMALALYANEENRPAIVGICAAVFLLASMFFVRRSFYGLRIGSE